MGKQFQRSLAKDRLHWIDLGSGILTADFRDHAQRQIRTARALIQRLFGPNPTPGVILGDEVGMGKTYEALAVIAALFRHHKSARVLILTHNHEMATVWMDRWDWFRDHAVASGYKNKLQDGQLLYDTREVGKGRLGFASYDQLKRVPTQELRCALERCFKGRYLRGNLRRKLVREMFGKNLSPTNSEFADKISQGALDHFWRVNFDCEERSWCHPWAAQMTLRQLIYRASRTRRQIDLLIVDEAHKVDSNQRSMFFAEVLGSRARRALYITATPFSLSIDQLYARIEDMHAVTGVANDGLDPNQA